MKVNREIRAAKVRLIDQDGELVGVISLQEALMKAEEQGLDLVEVNATSVPPVCKILDYGKLRYDQTKKEKENRKSQHQIKIKKLKFTPNITDHDLETKMRHAREFLEDGCKVEVTCMFRGREVAHPEVGEQVLKKLQAGLVDIALIEAAPKLAGRSLAMLLAPQPKKKK